MGEVDNFTNAPIIGKTIQIVMIVILQHGLYPSSFPENCKLETQVNVFNQRLDGNKHLFI
jgi:hypothetical protein